MDDKLKATLRKIKLLSDQNPEFAKELRKMFEKPSSASVVYNQESLATNIYSIREALEIRADKTISYDFVIHARFKEQLIVDNLRMENAILDFKKSEKERFYAFCVNAFYQLENIINYYFHRTYPNISDLLHVIEIYTSKEADAFRFVRKGKEINVSDIPMCDKINAFCNIFFPEDNIKATLGTLRKVRNEGEHRWSSIIDNNDGNNQLYKFYRYQTFNSIRSILERIVLVISENITIPVNVSQKTVDAMITSVLASACYVRYGETVVEVPSGLFYKVRHCYSNQPVKLKMSGPKILDIMV